MAKDTVFPDDKLEWKPHPDARSVLDEFRQVTNSLECSSAQLRGEKLDGAAVRACRNADAGKPKTRASIVSESKRSLRDLAQLRVLKCGPRSRRTKVQTDLRQNGVNRG